MTKPLNSIMNAIKARQKSVALWWLKMSDQEHRAIVRRGATIAACAFAVCMLLPVIGVRYEDQRLQAEFRADARELALSGAAGDAVRAKSDAAPLLEHSWLRTVEHSVERDPRASLSRYAMYARDHGAVSSVVADFVDRYDVADQETAEYDCLTQAVYYEAGFERVQGRLAVAEVILNRVSDHRYPNSVCEVVFQGATRTTGCQFTFTCDGALGRKPDPEKWEEARTIAAHVLMDLHERRTGSATHYHATYVDPIWNAGLVRTQKIGAHIFYRFPRGSEWIAARNAVARKKAQRAQLVSYEGQGFRVSEGRSTTDQLNTMQLKEASFTPAP